MTHSIDNDRLSIYGVFSMSLTLIPDSWFLNIDRTNYPLTSDYQAVIDWFNYIEHGEETSTKVIPNLVPHRTSRDTLKKLMELFSYEQLCHHPIARTEKGRAWLEVYTLWKNALNNDFGICGAYHNKFYPPELIAPTPAEHTEFAALINSGNFELARYHIVAQIHKYAVIIEKCEREQVADHKLAMALFSNKSLDLDDL